MINFNNINKNSLSRGYGNQDKLYDMKAMAPLRQ